MIKINHKNFVHKSAPYKKEKPSHKLNVAKLPNKKYLIPPSKAKIMI
jgi:hypothetical protein